VSDVKIASFLGLLRESFRESFWKGWAVFGAVTTLMPVAATIVQRHYLPLAKIRWIVWASANQAEIQIGIAVLVLLAYLIYAPYRLQRDRLVTVVTERDKLRNELKQRPIAGIPLRKECDKWIENGKALRERLIDEQIPIKAREEEALKWLEEFDQFAELNLSVADYDAVTLSERRSEKYFNELAKLKPATRLNNYQRMVGHRYGWLGVFRNKIK